MNFFLIFQPFGLCVSQADINGLWSRWDQWFCFMCANPTGGSGFPLVGIGGFLTRELYWQRRNSPSWLQKQKGRAGGAGSKMEETGQTWTVTVNFQMENIEAKSKRCGYRWLRQRWVWETNRHLVGAGNACYRLPYRAQSKVTPGRYLQVIGVGISISSIYWWAVRWRKCPKVGEKKRQTNKN